MKIKFLSGFVLMIAMVSCKITDLPQTQLSVGKNLYGKWTWLESTGGFAGTKLTPATTLNYDELELNADGTYRRLRNGDEFSKGQFQMETGNSITNASRIYDQILYKESGFKQSVTELKSDTLLLVDETNDGYTSKYVRQK